MQYKTPLSPTLFESESHARWSMFFTSLGVRWEYKVNTIKLPEWRTYTPTFTLPEYSGGVYVEVGAWAMGENDKSILARLERPLWILPETPEARVSYVYHLDEFENIQVTPVVPGFFHKEKKFFTNPTQIDGKGYVLPRSLEKHGRALEHALTIARAGKVEQVDDYYTPQEMLKIADDPVDATRSMWASMAVKTEKPANGSLYPEFLKKFIPQQGSSKKEDVPEVRDRPTVERKTVYRIQGFVGEPLTKRVLDVEYFSEGLFFAVNGTKVRIHIETLRELLAVLDKEIAG